MSIYTLTLNPTLDLSGYADKVVPNEKTYVRGEVRSPGGNGVNAARIINRLSARVTVMGFAGGSTGDELKMLLRKEGVRSKFTTIKQSTRINVTVSNLQSHLQTRFSFRGPEISSVERQNLLGELSKLKSGSLLVVGGSLPSGISRQFLAKILLLLKRRGISTIIDVPGTDLRKLIKARPLLIKPNLVEFQALIGRKVHSIDQVRRAAKKILRWVPVICISSVEGGALIVTQESAWFGRVPKIKVRSTVGAGDSMVGAMAVQMHKVRFEREKMKFGSAGDLLRWGLAAAGATLTHSGTELGAAGEVRTIYKKTKVRRVTE